MKQLVGQDKSEINYHHQQSRLDLGKTKFIANYI